MWNNTFQDTKNSYLWESGNKIIAQRVSRLQHKEGTLAQLTDSMSWGDKTQSKETEAEEGKKEKESAQRDNSRKLHSMQQSAGQHMHTGNYQCPERMSWQDQRGEYPAYMQDWNTVSSHTSQTEHLTNHEVLGRALLQSREWLTSSKHSPCSP